MTTFTRILQFLFILLGIVTFVSIDSITGPLFLFAFAGLGAIILLLILIGIFGFYFGIVSTIIFGVAPLATLFVYNYLNSPFGNISFPLLSGIQIFNIAPLFMPLLSVTVLGASLFFTRYLLMPKTTSEYYNFIWAAIASLPVVVMTLISYPVFVAKGMFLFSPTGAYYGVPFLVYLMPILVSLIAFGILLQFSNLNFETFNTSFTKLGAFIYVLVAMFFGVLAIQTQLFTPFMISLAILVFYLVMKYNYVKQSLKNIQ